MMSSFISQGKTFPKNILRPMNMKLPRPPSLPLLSSQLSLSHSSSICQIKNISTGQYSKNASSRLSYTGPAAFKSLPPSLCDVAAGSKHHMKNMHYAKSLQNHYETINSIVEAGGGKRAIERHVVRNKKMLPLERMAKLFDDEKYFELSKFAGIGMDYGDIPRAGSIAGIGKIYGNYCIVVANDATIKAGTIYPITLKKQLRVQEIAEQNRLPVIYLVDSGGAFLPLQSEIFMPGGRSFYNIAELSAAGIPQIALVCGSCTAGAAYIPTMSDEAVIVHRIGTIFLAGPPLVQAATGEVVTAEDLGGATLHSSVSGCTDYFAATEDEALETTRDIVASLNLPMYSHDVQYDEPLYDVAELDAIMPASGQHNINIYQVIARLVDGSRFHEFKQKYGSSLVAGFAHLEGHLVGFVCNHGKLTGEGAAKGAHFVSLCCERDVPLVFLQNVHPDDATGLAQTDPVVAANQLRDHGKMLAAVSCARVPKLTIVLGASYPPISYIMGGRCTSPNFIFSWPSATMSVMETENMTSQLEQGVSDELYSADDVTNCLEKITEVTSSFYATSRLLDDGLILPHETRQVLGQSLQFVKCYRRPEETRYPVFRM